MAFCPSCGTESQAGAAFCIVCGGSIQPRLQPTVVHPIPESTPTDSIPTHSVAASQIPPPDNAAFNRNAPRARRAPSVLSVVFATLAAEFGLLVIVFLIVARPAKEAFHDLIDKTAEETRDGVTKIYGVKELATRDAALMEFMGSASKGNSGDGDERLNRLAQNIRAYVAIADTAHTDSCPSEVVDAYKRHISLWDDVAQAVAAHPHIPSEEEALVSRMMQNLTGNFNSNEAQEQQIAVWALHVRDAEEHAEQGTQNFLDASKSAINAAGE
jgi:hypothetical protein